MKYSFLLTLLHLSVAVIAQDTLTFKLNNGGATSRNSSINLTYSIGDVLTSPANTKLSVYPIATLPETLATGFSNNTVKETEVSVFPNPVAQTLFIHSDNERGRLVLFDSNGKKLKDTTWPMELPMQDLATGEYFLLLISDKESTQSFKIIKQ